MVASNGLPETSSSSSVPSRAILLCATLAAAALRLYGLDDQPLWLDELASMRNAKAFGAGGFEALASIDHIAPLHSIILWLAMGLGGETAWAVRLPSALLSIGTVPLVYLVGLQLLRSRRAALIGAALMVISPLSLWYAQEARMYSGLLFCTLAFVALSWNVRRRSLRPHELVLLTLVTAAGYAMHHYMALLVAAFGLFLVLEGQAFRGRTWGWVGSQIVSASVLVGWLVMTADKLGASAGTEKPAFLLWLPYTFYTYVVGYSFGPAVRELQAAGPQAPYVLLDNVVEIIAAALATAIILLLAVYRLDKLRREPGFRWLILWLVGPIALALAATMVTNIAYHVRYVIMSFPAMLLLLAWGLSQFRFGQTNPAITTLHSPRADRSLQLAGGAAAATLLACIAISDVNHFANPRYAKEDVRSLANFLKSNGGEALLVTANSQVARALTFYGGPLPSRDLSVEPFLLNRASRSSVLKRVQAELSQRARETWLIQYRIWDADPDHRIQRFLDTHATLIEERRWPGVSLRRYAPLSGGAR